MGTGRGSGRTGWPRRCSYRLAGMTHDLAVTMRALAAELGEDTAAGLPSTVAEVVATAELTEGVWLGELLAVLEPDPQAVEAALAEILRAAAELPPDEAPDIAGHLQQWEPVIAAIVAACRGDQEAPPELQPFLEQAAQAPEWAALAGVVRRILGGSATSCSWTAWIRWKPRSPWRSCAGLGSRRRSGIRSRASGQDRGAGWPGGDTGLVRP